MPGYQLRAPLSFCVIDGRPVFLDVAKDRYFRLSDEMEPAFLALLRGQQGPADTEALIAHGILVDSGHGSPCPARAAPASSSVLETPSVERHGRLLLFIEVAFTLHQARRRLVRYGLEPALAWALARSGDRAGPQDLAKRLDAARWASAFLTVRKYVTTPTRCLLDSLAMMRFLGRRGLRPALVFGITGEPFTAHCWLQAGPLVLNDSVGNTRAYTPIKVA